MRKRLTDASVRATRPSAARVEIPDEIVPALRLVVQPSGAKSWAVRYKLHGRGRKLTLGKAPAISVGDARAMARKALEAISLGRDPATEKRQARLVRPQTFGELAEIYLKRHAQPTKRTWREDRSILKRHILPEWERRPVADISRADLLALMERVERRGPSVPRHVLAMVRGIFNWAVAKALVEASPVVGVRGPAAMQRDRVLADAELKEIWQACETVGWPWGPLVQLLMILAQRRGEVAAMRWDSIDGDIWELAAAETKAGRTHDVPLPVAAQGILAELPRFKSPYVFPANGNPENPVSGFTKGKARIDKVLLEARQKTNPKAEPVDWRLHDLRRTATSGMARLDVPPHILAAVLNHSPGSLQGVTAIYNRHQYLKEKRKALDAWAAELRRIVRGAELFELRR